MADEIKQEELGEEIEKDQYLVFSVKSQEFAIQAMRVQEISRVLPATAVPTAPSYIEGILNLRGQLATVINFRKKFNFEQKGQDEDTRIIIVEHAGYPIGILVDSVAEVIKIPDEQVQKLPEAASTTISKEYITGVSMMEKRIVILLDADKLLTKNEMIEVEAAKEAVSGQRSANRRRCSPLRERIKVRGGF